MLGFGNRGQGAGAQAGDAEGVWGRHGGWGIDGASVESLDELGGRADGSRGPGESDRAFDLRRVPLRVWVVVLIVTISGAGLVVSSLAVTSTMRDVIYSRVDEELQSSMDGWANNSGLFRAGDVELLPPTDYCVIKILPDGSTVLFNGSHGTPSLDQLPPEGAIETLPSAASAPGDEQWRTIVRRDEGITTVVAKSLEQENSILARLMVVQFIISAIVLVILALLAYYLAYRALRPLREVERTAGEIAAGELDKRVPSWPQKTEVGQLSRALNTMLERLQGSLEHSRQREEQMRRFVGDASHELRTPLTSVRGYGELYRAGAIKDADKVLEKIDAESERMSLLVEDLLALTRAEGQRLDLKPVDMLEVGLSVVSSARAAFPERSISLDNRTEGVPVVKGDASRLHQVLLNLVTNGVRHGGEDASVTVRLARGQDENGDREVIVRVVDDGVGMSKEDAAHIFERFYRADQSRSRASGGSGLGLAIAKSLVEQHGGSVAVDSEPGKGSTFTIRLPLLAEDEDADADE